MYPTTLSRFISIAAAVFLISCCCSCLVYADENDVVIVVNKNAPETDLSKERIKQIFIGKITMWSSNERIVLAMLDDDALHKAFLDKYVQRNPAQFKNTWTHLMFTGKAMKPRRFSTMEELKHFIAGNRLAIGYITKGAADDNIQVIIP